jgi:hypothetical protein
MQHIRLHALSFAIAAGLISLPVAHAAPRDEVTSTLTDQQSVAVTICQDPVDHKRF